VYDDLSKHVVLLSVMEHAVNKQKNCMYGCMYVSMYGCMYVCMYVRMKERDSLATPGTNARIIFKSVS